MADTIIENLITTLTFDYDERILLKFSEGIEKIILNLEAMVRFASDTSRAIFDFTENVAISNDKIGNLAKRIGIDIRALQELGFVAELNGSSIESMNSALENIAIKISEAARGVGDGIETFGMLGISVTDAEGRLRSADDVFLNIADSISMLSTQAQRVEFAQRLGISGNLVLAVQQGSEAIREQRREAAALNFTIGVEGAAAAANFLAGTLKLRRILLGIRNTIATRLMTVIEPMIEAWVKWLKTNNQLIKQGINRFIDLTVNALGILRTMLAVTVSLVEHGVNAIGGWENAIKGVTAALLILNRALLKPLLVLGGFVLFLLLLQDLKVFAEEGDSVIGELVKKFPILAAPINLLISALQKAAEGWKLILEEGDRAIEGLMIILEEFREDFIQTFTIDLPNRFKDAWYEVSYDFDRFMRRVIRTLNWLPGTNIPLPEQLPALEAPVAPGVLRQEGFGPTTNVTNNSNTTNPNISISINGGNPQEIRQTLFEILNEQYQSAIGNVSSGVSY